MTTDQTQDVQPVRIGGSKTNRNTEHDLYPFNLGDDNTVLWGTRPPLAVLLDVIAAMEDDSDPVQQGVKFNELLAEVLTEESEAYLRGRFRDRADELDLDHPDVTAMFQHLVGVWYGQAAGPTGGRRGSAAPSARTGTRSTARSRSKG